MSFRTEAPRRRVTLRDVAAAANVSVMTVSNVINGKFASMTRETRRRIEEAIESLNYRPHAMARNLRVARRFSIGLIIVDPSPTYLADPFTTHMVAGLSNYLSSRNYVLVLQGQTPGSLAGSSLLRNVLTDGFCLMLSGESRRRREIVENVAALGQPVVLFQEARAPKVGDICIVRQNDRDGGRQLAEHVLARRRERARLAYLTTAWQWPALHERERGIQAAIRARGGGARFERIVCASEGVEDVVSRLDEYLAGRPPPDAIFAGNDQMGIAALKHLRALGIRVPDDVLVTGFNAFSFREFSSPILTSVRSPAYELGATGGEALIERLASGAFARRKIVMPVELLAGGST